MEREGKKSVAIVGTGIKKVITATFLVGLAGSILLMQSTYDGKRDRSIPNMSRLYSSTSPRLAKVTSRNQSKLLQRLLLHA